MRFIGGSNPADFFIVKPLQPAEPGAAKNGYHAGVGGKLIGLRIVLAALCFGGFASRHSHPGTWFGRSWVAITLAALALGTAIGAVRTFRKLRARHVERWS